MDHWYFAYGSNLLSNQMVARTGLHRLGIERPQIACLPRYRLAFNMLGDDGQVYANIVQPGDGVLGVVYRCNRACLEKLDAYEQGYDRQAMVVVGNKGLELSAFVYIARPECVTAEAPPSAAYLQKIVAGARAHGLPENYIRGCCGSSPAPLRSDEDLE